MRVRVIACRLQGVPGAEPDDYRLVTDLLDAEQYPAGELAGLCRERWETESVLGEIKTHQRGAKVVLTGKTPDGVRQQIWAHLLVHHALRELMARTAAARGLGPDRLSFTATLWCARRSVTTTPGVFSPELLVTALARLRDDLLAQLLPPRRVRSQPRVVKRKKSHYRLKRAEHHAWPQPTRAANDAIIIYPP